MKSREDKEENIRKMFHHIANIRVHSITGTRITVYQITSIDEYYVSGIFHAYHWSILVNFAHKTIGDNIS